MLAEAGGCRKGKTMANKRDHDGKSGRNDSKAETKPGHEKDATNSRTASKQNAGTGGHK